MVPEIQLMMRVERAAELQRRPSPEDRGDYALFELIRPAARVQWIKHSISRFAVGNQSMKAQKQGELQCKCAC
ncbi:MAG TPA: hypothetical protein DCL15_14870 [Chloroflexi bacterium]|nr:hypothetical protein [Chloroflexota bacterium]HHW85745.1 hypothetical protein [Chloroflexota bacterium]